MLVESFIQRSQIQLHIRMSLLHSLHTFGAADDIHHDDVLAATGLQKVDGGNGAAAGGQHGIHHEDLPLIDILGQLAVVFHRLMGLGVTVQTDVSHLGRGDQIDHVVHHAQTGTEDRDNGQLLACQHLTGGNRHRSLHLNLLGGQIAGGFIAHQACDLTDQSAEFLNTGVLIAKNCQLMLDQRMVQNVYSCHIDLSLVVIYSLKPFSLGLA